MEGSNRNENIDVGAKISSEWGARWDIKKMVMTRRVIKMYAFQRRKVSGFGKKIIVSIKVAKNFSRSSGLRENTAPAWQTVWEKESSKYGQFPRKEGRWREHREEIEDFAKERLQFQDGSVWHFSCEVFKENENNELVLVHFQTMYSILDQGQLCFTSFYSF